MKCSNCLQDVPEGNFCDQCGYCFFLPKGPEVSPGLESVVSGDEKQTLIEEISKTPAAVLHYIPDKYELVREIGRGGMGIVYEGIDKSLNRRVAIKCLKEEIVIKQRIKNEFIESCKRVAKLDEHPNIVGIYEFFEQDNKIYVVFEYVEGKNLDVLLDGKGKFTIKEAIEILVPVLEALSFAHKKGIIHRDLKPSNIIVTGEDKVKVVDFDIARELKDSITRTSGVMDTSGTLPYMAPEQERGKFGVSSDIFSVGVLIYEMLTGKLPFPGPNFYIQKINRDYLKPSEVDKHIPPQIDEIIDRCFCPESEKRYQSADELLKDLLKIADLPEKPDKS